MSTAKKGNQIVIPEEHKQEVEDILHKVFEEKMIPQDALGLNKDMVEGIYAQAYMLYNSGNYKQASQVFRLLITLNPIEMKYVMGLAASQHLMKDYKNAAITYQLCSMMNLNDPIPHYHASDCFLKMNDPGSAALSLDIAIRLAANKPEYRALSDRCKMTLSSLKEELDHAKKTR